MSFPALIGTRSNSVLRGTFVGDQYHLINTKPIIIRLTDLFCTGDSFALYDNGVLLGRSIPVPPSCSSTAQDPDNAFASLGWSSFYAFAAPGDHLFTIQVVDSPYSAGGAAISFYNANA